MAEAKFKERWEKLKENAPSHGAEWSRNTSWHGSGYGTSHKRTGNWGSDGNKRQRTHDGHKGKGALRIQPAVAPNNNKILLIITNKRKMKAKWLSKNVILVLPPEAVIIYDSSGWPRSVCIIGVLLFYFYLRISN